MLKYSYRNVLQQLWDGIRKSHPDLKVARSYPGRFKKQFVAPLDAFADKLSHGNARAAGKFLRGVELDNSINKNTFRIKTPTSGGWLEFPKNQAPVEVNMRKAFGAGVDPVKTLERGMTQSGTLSQPAQDLLSHNNPILTQSETKVPILQTPGIDTRSVTERVSGDPAFTAKRIAQFNKIPIDEIEYAVTGTRGKVPRQLLRRARRRLSGSRLGKAVPVEGKVGKGGWWNHGGYQPFRNTWDLDPTSSRVKLDMSTPGTFNNPKYHTSQTHATLQQLTGRATKADAMQSQLLHLAEAPDHLVPYSRALHELNHTAQDSLDAIGGHLSGVGKLRPLVSEGYSVDPVEIMQGNRALKEAISAYQHTPGFAYRNPELDKFLRSFDINTNDPRVIARQMKQLEQFPVEDIIHSLGGETGTRAVDHWSNMRQSYRNIKRGVAKGIAWQQQEVDKLRKVLELPELNIDNPMLDVGTRENIRKLRQQISTRIKELSESIKTGQMQSTSIKDIWNRYPSMFKISSYKE